MDDQFVSDPVPFMLLGNRRCLTYQQLIEHPVLAAFVKSFPASFEHRPDIMVAMFVEPTFEGSV